ncbi:hypothetical protein B0H13DRAFT_1896602 [Mycena leptocephala]|nr:hypothetical protein B0H13DRAFT_1896602 [Mycena leptocephala]
MYLQRYVRFLCNSLAIGGLIVVICWMLQAIKDKKLVTARWIWYKVQWFFQDYTGCTSLINDLIETIGVRASYAHIGHWPKGSVLLCQGPNRQSHLLELTPILEPKSIKQLIMYKWIQMVSLGSGTGVD